MPRARFDKLPGEKRERIRRAAFAEFAAQGLDLASTNRIAEAAGVSKGLLFYYFDGKEDLFAMVVGEVCRELLAAVEPPTTPPRDPESFWAAFERIYVEILATLERRSELRSFVLATTKTQSLSLDHPLLADAVAYVSEFMDRLLATGRACAAVRADLPASLVAALLRAVALSVDPWLVQGELAPRQVIDLYRRLLAPPVAGG